MKKALHYIIVFLLILCYVNCYSKVYAQSHEKREDTKFIFPAACHYGQDCWAVNYVDTDTDENEASDFECGSKTYDEHKGTDFALGSIAQMRDGVNVLAAAAGNISRVRDGQSDALKSKSELAVIKEDKKECGNGVLIDHGNDLKTIYCQLKEGSIVVKPRQRVRAGQKIAQVGQSGYAKLPHLHFGVFREGIVIDPYTGEQSENGCGVKENPMWHIGLPMKYETVAIFDGGFRSETPNFESIRSGYDVNPSTLAVSSSALVFWVGFYNVEAGDEVVIKIYDPAGELFDTSTQTARKTRTQQYFYTGRKATLKEGVYTARVKFSRSGKYAVSKVKEFSVSVK